jgi:hypothetical protein
MTNDIAIPLNSKRRLAATGRAEPVGGRAVHGHLRPFMPQKTRVANDWSQGTADVARRRTSNEKIY